MKQIEIGNCLDLDISMTLRESNREKVTPIKEILETKRAFLEVHPPTPYLRDDFQKVRHGRAWNKVTRTLYAREDMLTNANPYQKGQAQIQMIANHSKTL
jgi:hypothetical protein